MKVNEIVSDLEAKLDLIFAVERCSDWNEVGSVLGISANAAGKRHRRLISALTKAGLTVDDLVQIAKQREIVNPDTQSDNWAATYLQKMGLDPKHYTINPRSIWSNGDSTNASFRVAPKPLNQEDVLDIVREILDRVDVNIKPPKTKRESDGYLAVFSLYDPHIAKLARGKSMVDVYKFVLTDLVEKVLAGPLGVSKAVLVIGQDFVNFDNALGTTTQGTVQENSMPYREAITVQSSVAIWAVNMLANLFSEVEIHLVPGNHDRYSNFWLYTLLENLYKEHKTVKVVGGETWSVVTYEDVGIFVIHGDLGKSTDYLAVWATSDPLSFAQARYKEIHTGHLHTMSETITRKYDQKGVVHRTMPGLTSTDTWHNERLYINNNRYGLVTIYNSRYPETEHYCFIED